MKTAAQFAFVGTLVVAILLAFEFVRDLINMLQGLIPAVTAIASFIWMVGAASIAVFFFVYSKRT